MLREINTFEAITIVNYLKSYGLKIKACYPLYAQSNVDFNGSIVVPVSNENKLSTGGLIYAKINTYFSSGNVADRGFISFIINKFGLNSNGQIALDSTSPFYSGFHLFESVALSLESPLDESSITIDVIGWSILF